MYRSKPWPGKTFGARSAAVECASSVPRFSLSSLSTKEFLWLREDGWDDEQKTAFCALRQAPPAVIFSSLPYLRARQRDAPEMLGAWLLLSAEKLPLAMVEAQIMVTGYSRLSVLVSAAKAEGGWLSPKAKAALSLLVSGLIIMTRSDLVTLVPLGPSVEGELADLGFGAKRTLWSPYLSTTRLQHDITGIRVECRAIEAHEWWLTEGGERDQKTLAYLEKRVRIDEEKGKPPKPKARGFMERLNGLLRWS